MLRKSVYPKIEAFLLDIAKKLEAQGFTPNQLTLGGLALNFLAGCLFASGHLALGGIVMLLAGLGDMFDGPLARVSGKASKFGAFLDSTVDRYSDFFLFGGVALYLAKLGDGLYFVLSMGVILGSFVISYAKARAEAMGDACNVGIFERTERIVILAFGTILAPLFDASLWILFIGTHFTAIQRIQHVKKTFSEEPKKPSV